MSDVLAGDWLLVLYWITALFTVISGFNYMARGVGLMNHGAKKAHLP